MRIVILAAGEASRWGHFLGHPKHLVPVHGEPILHRTVRLLRELSPGAEIYIAARRDALAAYAVTGAVTVEADLDPRRFDADKFLSSRRYWAEEGDTILLYGDCFYTRAALVTITGTPVEDWLLFARFNASAITGCDWPEPFAFRLARHYQDRFAHVGESLVRRYVDGELSRIGGWEFYAYLTGGDLSRPGERAGNSVAIDDWTEDFDYPRDFTEWAHRAILHGGTHVL